MARFFNVGVETFSIGFGKALFAYTDPKTGTCWQLGPIPLGGFVALKGEKTDPSSIVSSACVQGRPFISAPLHAKVAILVAGVAVNLFFAAITYTCLAYGSMNPARPILASPVSGSLAAIAGIQSGDEVVAFDGDSVSSWRDIQMKLLALDEAHTPIELKVLRGDRAVNIRLTLARTQDLHSNNMMSVQSLEEELGLRLRAIGMSIQGFAPDSPAERAGLRTHDLLTHLDTRPLEYSTNLKDALNNYSPSQNGMVFDALRGDEKIKITIRPALDANKLYKLGVQFAPVALLNEHGITLFAAVQHGFSDAYLATLLTVKALFQFLKHPFSNDQLAGPITIAKTAKASADRGWESALAFLAGLSVSVGVLNLLPVPVLDGGQVLYHLIRASFGRLARLGAVPSYILQEQKIRHAIEKLWVSFGVAFVVFLTVTAFYTDIMRLLSSQ
jgi:regulator of sigma E protease